MIDREPTQTRADHVRSQKKSTRKKWLKTAGIITLILLLWSGLVYGGYHYASNHLLETQQYFAEQLQDIKLENQRIEEEITGTMRMFHDELEKSNLAINNVRSELNRIQEELELTGETITGSDETRQSLQERITELDHQLTALKDQLRKLEDAARAF